MNSQDNRIHNTSLIISTTSNKIILLSITILFLLIISIQLSSAEQTYIYGLDPLGRLTIPIGVTDGTNTYIFDGDNLEFIIYDDTNNKEIFRQKCDIDGNEISYTGNNPTNMHCGQRKYDQDLQAFPESGYEPSTAETLKNWPAALKDTPKDIWNCLGGLKDAGIYAAMGICSTIAHPFQTAEGIGALAGSLYYQPKETIQSYKTAYATAYNNNPGRTIGMTIGSAGLFFVPWAKSARAGLVPQSTAIVKYDPKFAAQQLGTGKPPRVFYVDKKDTALISRYGVPPRYAFKDTTRILESPGLAETFVKYGDVRLLLTTKGKKKLNLLYLGGRIGKDLEFHSNVVGLLEYMLGPLGRIYTKEKKGGGFDAYYFGERGFVRDSDSAYLGMEKGGPPYSHTDLTVSNMPNIGYTEAHLFYKTGHFGSFGMYDYEMGRGFLFTVEDYPYTVLPTGEIIPTRHLMKELYSDF